MSNYVEVRSCHVDWFHEATLLWLKNSVNISARNSNGSECRVAGNCFVQMNKLNPPCLSSNCSVWWWYIVRHHWVWINGWKESRTAKNICCLPPPKNNVWLFQHYQQPSNDKRLKNVEGNTHGEVLVWVQEFATCINHRNIFFCRSYWLLADFSFCLSRVVYFPIVSRWRQEKKRQPIALCH